MVTHGHQIRARRLLGMVRTPLRHQRLLECKIVFFPILQRLQHTCIAKILTILFLLLFHGVFKQGTHYFQLTSSHGGTQTEFTQGKKYHGWGTSLYSVAGSIEGARRGLVAMNSALAVETVRRKQLSSKSTTVEKATTVNEKTIKDSDSEMVDLAVVDLDISDSAAVAVATADSSFEPSEEPEPTCASPKPDKRTSIIGAGISSLFGGGSKPSMPSSSSRDDLINPAIAEETEDGDEGEEGEDEDGDDDGEDGFELPPEDPETKRQREAKNAERIELDLGGGELSMADFGF